MKNRYVERMLYALLLLTLSLQARVYADGNSENHRVVDGVAIYIGIMPAEMILGHPRQHAERQMHGGVPTGKHRDHLVVALFDDATGKRITDARVTASVGEIGLAEETKRLDTMKIAGTVTYGNFFDLPSRNIYRIRLQIRLPGATRVIETEFTHRHYSE